MGMRATLGLLVVVGVLVLALRLTQERPDEAQDIQVSVLEGHLLQDATRIRFQVENLQPVEMEVERFGWFRLVEPIEDLASRARLASIATAFDGAMMTEAYEDQDVDEELLAELGLEPPRATLEVDFEDGSKVELAIGARGPLGTDRFLLRDGVIYRGGTALYTSLNVNVDDLRERQVFRTSPGSAESVTVTRSLETGAQETLRLERRGRDWRLVEPIDSRVETQATQGFLAEVLGLRIDQFPGGVVRIPERDPDIVVKVTGPFGEEEARLWRLEGDDLLGWQDGRELAFVSERRQFLDIFRNAVNLLRARWLIPIANLNEQLVQVVLDPGQGAGRRVVLRRSGEQEFRMYEPTEIATLPTPVAQLIQALNNCRVLQFVEIDPEAAGLTRDFFTVSALGQFDRQPTELQLGDSTTIQGVRVTYVRRADEPDRVVAIAHEPAELLRRPWTDYVTDRVLRLSVAVDRLVVEPARAGTGTVWVKREGRWHRQGEELPEAMMGELVDELRDLRAERAFDAREMELGEEDLSLALTRANGDELARLRFWDRGAGQPLLVARPRHPSVVWELKPRLSEDLRALWRE